MTKTQFTAESVKTASMCFSIKMQTVRRVSHSHLFLIVTAGKELESGTAHCCLGGWPDRQRKRA